MTQPSIACGPPMAASASGIVRKGPTPTMFSTFVERTPQKPIAANQAVRLCRKGGHVMRFRLCERCGHRVL